MRAVESVHAVGPGEPVGVQAGAVDQHVGAHRAGRRLDHGARPVRGQPDHLGAQPQLRTGGEQLGGQRLAERGVVGDRGDRNPQRCDGVHERLVLPGLLRSQPGHLDPVGQAALVQPLQPGQLGGLGCHDQLAGCQHRNAVLGRVAGDRGGAGSAQPRLGRARPVVDAGVHHAGVTSALVPGERRLLLQHGDLAGRIGLSQGASGGQPDDAAADDQVPGWHQGAGDRTRRRRKLPKANTASSRNSRVSPASR